MLWLSKEAEIDEVSALRIAVLEWQTRPEAQLLQGPDDDTISSEGNGNDHKYADLFDPGMSTLPTTATPSKDKPQTFERGEERHRRLLEIYLSERRFVLKTSEYLMFSALFEADLMPMKEQRQAALEWLHQAGNDISKSHAGHPAINAVNALRRRLEALGGGIGWSLPVEIQDEMEITWARNQILEMMHIMQITLNLLLAESDLPRSSAILAWFGLMRDYRFFDDIPVVSD